MSYEYCPLIKENCVEHKCKFYINILGTHPQTGEQLSKWDCSLSWIPILLVENSKEQRQTAKSIQSFRNEMVKTQMTLLEGNGENKNVQIEHIRD